MGFLINLKKLGVSTTVLAHQFLWLRVEGGSDGYYDNGSSNSDGSRFK